MSTAPLPGWLRPANMLVKLLQKLGVSMGTIHVLTVRGRRSGKPRTTPVSPLTVGGKRYVIAGLAQGDWACNARAAGRGVLARGRTRRDVELPEVTDPDERRTVASAFPTEVNASVLSRREPRTSSPRSRTRSPYSRFVESLIYRSLLRSAVRQWRRRPSRSPRAARAAPPPRAGRAPARTWGGAHQQARGELLPPRDHRLIFGAMTGGAGGGIAGFGAGCTAAVTSP